MIHIYRIIPAKPYICCSPISPAKENENGTTKIDNTIKAVEVFFISVPPYKITPGVIGIGDQLIAVLVVYGHNVALQVFLEPVDIILPVEIAVVMILHTNGCSIGIVDIQHKMLA